MSLYGATMIAILLVAVGAAIANIVILKGYEERFALSVKLRQSVVAPLLWGSVVYYLFRFPFSGIIALGEVWGRVVLIITMFTGLFIPVWLGLVGLLVWAVRRIQRDPVDPFDHGIRWASWVILILLLWGLLGEVRLWLDPSVFETIGKPLPQ